MKTTHPAGLAALLLGAALAACGGTGETASGAARLEANLTTSGVTATIAVDSWGGGYCGNVTLANGSTSAVTTWTLVVSLNGATLNNAWGATTSASGGLLTLKPVDYDAKIAPSASVTLGFCAAGSGTPTLQSLDVVGPVGPTSQTLTVGKGGQGLGTVTSTPAGVSCGTTCTAAFTTGTVVTLTAAANSGSLFTGWSGACSGTAATCTVTMSAAQSVMASFGTGTVYYPLTVLRSTAGMGFATVTSTPAGIDCNTVASSGCTASFAANTTVTLTAVTTGLNTFRSWSGACTGTSPTCTVSMTAAQTVTVTVDAPDSLYTLVATRSGTGGGTITSAPSGLNCGSTCSATFASSTVVTLTAAAASGSTFKGWSGACTGTSPTCIVSMTANWAATATFDLADAGATLSVNAGGAASGTFVADAYYSGGSTYSTTSAIDTTQVAGTAPALAVFQSERYGEFTYTIPNRAPGSAQTVTLYFAESYWTAAGQRTFSVAVNGTAVLTAFDIFAAAGGANKAIARTFNATANASGQVVIQFTKGGGADNPKVCGISVAGGVAPTFTLTVAKAGTGNGLVTGGGLNCGTVCSATVASGTRVTLSATADGGSTFGGWGGACSGSATTCAVDVTANQSVTATFTLAQQPDGLIRGINWADQRDNFVNGVLYVSGLGASDTYASASTVASRVVGQLYTITGANTVRIPINEPTVSSYWSTYTGALDAALTQGRVIFAYWAYTGGKPQSTSAFYSMWDKVVAKYGTNPNAYFEVINEPSGYGATDLTNFYNDWLNRYSTVPRSRVILDGVGLAQDGNSIGRDSRLNGTLIAIHDYSFFAGYESENEWANHLASYIGSYASRTVVTEWGGPMGPGSKNGVSYDTIDYSIPSGSFFADYIRGVSSKLHALGIGSVYWPGLRDADWYSLTRKSGTGAGITLTLVNASGLSRLQYAWGVGTGGGTYARIRNAGTGLYLDGLGSTSSGAAAGQSTAATGTTSQWVVENSDSYVRIRNRVTGLYLDGAGRTSNGADAGQWSSSTGTAQQWSVVTDANNVVLKNRATGLYLDGMGRTTSGAAAGQYAGSTSVNQRWKIVAAE